MKKRGFCLPALVITLIILMIFTLAAIAAGVLEAETQYNDLNNTVDTTCPLCNGTGKYEK